ncbi:MAG TPA: transposase [Vicinamibacterales bacterium]|jgi:REP element-mobilizing transposase RayT|nr:transposase [Vicinamibacterales bacterium]
MASRRPPRLHRDLYRGLQRYFLTICTIHRLDHFATRERAEMAMGQLLLTAAGYSFEIIAYCFMPDHAHGLFESKTEDADFLKFVCMYKQRSAFEFKKTTGGRLWQEGFYDHVLRDEESTLSVAAYIIQNPVRAGLCKDPREYPFVGSSQYSLDQLVDAIPWRP